MAPLPRWLAQSDTIASRSLRDRANEVPEDVRRVVYERAGFRCESCAVGLTPDKRHLHHRRPRGMGGSTDEATNRASNLIAICPDCHWLVEHNRLVALEHGLLVRQGADPARVPMLRAEGGLVLLDDAGGTQPWDPTVLPVDEAVS